MSYVENNLRKDEKVIVKAKISFWYLVPAIIGAAVLIVIGVLVKVVFGENITANAGHMRPETYESLSNVTNIITIVFIVIAALVVLWRIIVILNTHLAVTDKRIIGKTGVLSVKTLDIPIEKVDNCGFNAGVLGNLFKYYNVTVKSASGEYKFSGISNAQLFKDKTIDAIDNRQEYLRKAQASEIANAMNNKNL